MINRSRSMKKIFPAFGAALVASLVLSGLVAGSALALSYVPASGTFPANNTISGNGPVLEVAGETYRKVNCEKYAGTIVFQSGTTGTADIAFTGCRAPNLGVGGSICTTAGSPSGTIRTKILTVRPAYLNAEKTKYGVEMQGAGGGLDPFKDPAGTVATFACGVGGSVRTLSGVITVQIENPLNVETKSFSGFVNEATQKAGGGIYHIGLYDGGKVVTPTASWGMSAVGGSLAKFVP